jgi:replicative DNA helicase
VVDDADQPKPLEPEDQPDTTSEHIQEVLGSLLDEVEAAWDHGSSALLTGISRFDQIVWPGLQRRSFNLLAGQPGSGKTSFCLAAVRKLGQEHKGILYVSYETGDVTALSRLLGGEARIATDVLATGKLAEEQWPRLSHSVGRLSEARIVFADTAIDQLPQLAQRFEDHFGFLDPLDLIVVDGLGLCGHSDLASAGLILRQLAKRHQAVVLATLTTAGTTGWRDFRPLVGVADLFATLRPLSTKRLELRVRSNRYGRSGTTQLAFDPNTGVFYNEPAD